jgi:3-deoxy-D-manno-octulosonic-acid transferase
MAGLPLGLSVYRCATLALSPLAPLLLRQRMLRGKEDAMRLSERIGKTALPRPAGTLIWVHGASVGECMAALPLINALCEATDRTILMTSGTVTAARLMGERLPQGVLHQFAPLDTPGSVRRFLDHWKPAVGLFVDSEIWPNMILGAHKRGVKLGLINGRMSARSYEGWKRARKSAAALLARYDLCLATDSETAERLTALGAKDVKVTGSLKADAPPLPADQGNLDALRAAIGSRRVLLASQTHPGENETILPVHDALRREYPNLLTIIAPRHPERGAEIGMLCGTRRVASRSAGALPQPDTAIYIADTIGELGLFYRIAPFAFVGGSLIPHGGQNPLEPARLGCAVLAGPHTENFDQAYAAIFEAQGAGRVHNSAEIVALGKKLLSDRHEAKAMGARACAGAATLGGAVAKTRDAIEALLANHAHA